MIRQWLSALGWIIAIVAVSLLTLSEPDKPVPVKVTSLEANHQEVRVEMRDGIYLAADLYLPTAAGPFPTLVRKTPYSRERGKEAAKVFTTNGYAVLIVSQRGRFGSEGIFHQARNEGWLEHPDGYDTIEWAAQQSWSNGKIGTYGISSDAQWQLSTAPTRPPSLYAMFASYAAHHRIGGRMERGVHTSAGPTWHYNNNAVPRPLRTTADYAAWLAAWKQTRLPFIASFLHPEIVEQFVHNTYDDYWRDIDPATRYTDFDVPIYHESGWYDRYVRWSFQNFNQISQEGHSQRTRESQKVIMGPWVHGGDLPPETDTAYFGPAAKIDRQKLQLRWFDYWLKDLDTGIMDEPALRIYLMGADQWLEGDTWPLPDTTYVPYYFRSGTGKPSGSLNDGRLLKLPPTSEKPDEYVHDPYNPIPTIGGHGGYGRMWTMGPQDNRPAESRILTFTTDPLQQDLEVVGEIQARFFASSSAPDTDFVLTLTDVYPNGYSALLRQNVIRGRYRLSQEKESLLKPGQVYEFSFALDAIANLFKTGHRIRISIASSSFPSYLPNPGTAEPMHLVTHAVTAHNRIYHDSRYPSSIQFPIHQRKNDGITVED
ncbi:MAG: CocE/NonD family hydrolase [Acidobacteriota bacterium]|nr:CocE/NonD family hydrolase [Acidobacteriota bacterium]